MTMFEAGLLLTRYGWLHGPLPKQGIWPLSGQHRLAIDLMAAVDASADAVAATVDSAVGDGAEREEVAKEENVENDVQEDIAKAADKDDADRRSTDHNSTRNSNRGCVKDCLRHIVCGESHLHIKATGKCFPFLKTIVERGKNQLIIILCACSKQSYEAFEF